MKPMINRYAFTDHGPAKIWSDRKLTTSQARRVFKSYGLTVERFVPNWFWFYGRGGIIELDPFGLVFDFNMEGISRVE